MLPKPHAQDVMIFIYKDDDPPPRRQRLLECASRYALWRGLKKDGDFELDLAPGGKPYFPRRPELHFSVSHSGEYWLAAFQGQPLGLDIQLHEERDYLAIAKRWFHPDEYAAVKQYGPHCFFDIWSAKESLVKCSGAGLTSSFSAFSVVEGGAIAPHNGGLQLKPMNLIVGYSICLCGKEIKKVYLKSIIF